MVAILGWITLVFCVLNAIPGKACEDCKHHKPTVARSRNDHTYTYWCNECKQWVRCWESSHELGEGGGTDCGPCAGSKSTDPAIQSPHLKIESTLPGHTIVIRDTIVVHDTVHIQTVAIVPCPDIVITCPPGHLEYRHGDTVECIPDPRVPPSSCHKHVCTDLGIAMWVDTCNLPPLPPSGQSRPIRWEQGSEVVVEGKTFRLRETTTNGKPVWYLGAYRDGIPKPPIKVHGTYDAWRSNIYLIARGFGKFEPHRCKECD